ncbi:MAG: hypothetical protein ABJ056_10135 [Halioglobus sp.]
MISLRSAALPLTLIFLVLALAVVHAGTGSTEDNFRQIIRITAASSMILFSLTFSASALKYLLGNRISIAIMQARRRLGLSFALSHLVHLGAIVALVELVYAGDYSLLGDIAAGAVIYLFILAMALTSNNASVRLLGARNWTLLHKTGSYLIWVGLFATYLGAALETGSLHYWAYLSLGVGLLSLRGWVFWSKRKTIDRGA